jgi:hypothetical protein
MDCRTLANSRHSPENYQFLDRKTDNAACTSEYADFWSGRQSHLRQVIIVIARAEIIISRVYVDTDASTVPLRPRVSLFEKLGKDLLDGVEIRAVGWKEEELRASLAKKVADGTRPALSIGIRIHSI